MNRVRPKKYLGQHFLKDQNIAKKIVKSLDINEKYRNVLEIGPGMGMLTQYLLELDINLKAIEIDRESTAYLKQKFPGLAVVEADFLKVQVDSLFDDRFSIIGNFPYNISSQIFFKVLDNRDDVLEIVCMIQKEVAERISSPPGNKEYGILSVLLRAFYDIEYLFSVSPQVFAPPPKVKSAVIRLQRNQTRELNCNEKLFFKVVKQAFQTRRKTLRNALKALNLPGVALQNALMDKRAEELTVEDFVELTTLIQNREP
jgi:16S rRNA (adenine1518-N6/adenine1519-N6)-dimethyltransferase